MFKNHRYLPQSPYIKKNILRFARLGNCLKSSAKEAAQGCDQIGPNLIPKLKKNVRGGIDFLAFILKI